MSKQTTVCGYFTLFLLLWIRPFSSTACPLACHTHLNISLDATGQLVITPDMLLTNPGSCPDELAVTLTAPDGTIIPGNLIDCQYVGETIMAKVSSVDNDNSCWGTLLIEDKLEPVLFCNDITVNCVADIAPSAGGPVDFPLAQDNCDDALYFTYIDSVTEFYCPNIFSRHITRTWTGTDGYGNSDSCTQNIFIERATLDDISLPEHVENLDCHSPVSPDDVPGPTLFGFPLNQEMVCDFTATFHDQQLSLCGETEKIIRTWTIHDLCNQVSQNHIQFIKTIDNTPPEMTCLDDISIGTDFNHCFATYTSSALPEVEEDCGNYTLTLTSAFGDGNGPFELPVGEHLFTWIAIDDCDNTNTCEFIVTVIDNISPIPVCDDIVVALDADGTAELCATELDGGSTDNCALAQISIRRMSTCSSNNTDTIFNDCILLDCCDLDAPAMVILGTWDASGNYNECMTEVIVQDKLEPQIICPPNLTLECDQYPLADENTIGNIITIQGIENWPPQNPDGLNGYAYDNCGIDTITVSSIENFDECREGNIIRTFTATDLQGLSTSCTQIISFIDNTEPEISFPENVNLDCTAADDIFQLGTATAEDNCIPYHITFEDTDISLISDPCLTKILREWTVFDPCSYEIFTAIQVIKIIDSLPPIFENLPAESYTNICLGDPVPVTQPDASDNCSIPEVSLLDDITISGNCPDDYTVRRTWIATDGCGQTSTLIQDINIIDNIAPTLSAVPADSNLDCDDILPNANVFATDNCSDNIPVSETMTQQAGLCPDDYSITRIWVATDLCGNSSSASQTINFTDDTPPTFFNFPEDLTLDCADILPTAGFPMAEDNCDDEVEITLMETTSIGSCPDTYMLMRHFTASDNCNNVAIRTQTISITDTIAPAFSNVPSGFTQECGQAYPELTHPDATDNCDINPNFTFTENIITADCTDNYQIVRSWTVSDNCGNLNTITQTITISDTTPPVFNDMPEDLTLECSVPNPAMPGATDNCDNNVSISFMQSDMAGSCAGNQSIIRTWVATDNCGNSSTQTQTLTITDSTAPEISGLPADITINCEDLLPEATPMAFDFCDPDVVLEFDEKTAIDACANNIVVTRTWTATDFCENRTTATWIITKIDTEAPAINNVPADLNLNCQDSIPAAALVLSDNCDDAVDLSFTDERTDGDCLHNYTIMRTWTASDNCGNLTTASQLIQFIDQENPALMVPADITVQCDAVPDGTDPTQVNASDNCSLDIQIDFIDENIQQGLCTGAYTITRTWLATDECGNTATASQLITVEDTEAPTGDNLPVDITVECDAIPPPGIPVFTDNCSEVLVEFSTTTAPENCPQNYVETRTWIASDDCRNLTSFSQTVTITDTTSPIIEQLPDLTLECDNADNFTAPEITDNCDPDFILLYNETITDGSCPHQYTVIRKWTATDACGNSAENTQSIFIQDTTPPALTGPEDMTIECDQMADNNFVAMPTDNCTDNIITTFNEAILPGACVDSWSILRSWEATDLCGNIATISQTIFVDDTTAPEFIFVPADVTLSCGRLELLQSPFATDNCAINVDIQVVDDTISTSCTHTYSLIRNYLATDNCGNTATASNSITIFDETPPQISCPDNISTFTIGQFNFDCTENISLLATADDDCDDTIDITTRIININEDLGINLDTVLAGGDINFPFPLDTSLVIFFAEDDCGNISTCTTYVFVTEITSPFAGCGGFSAFLEGETSVVIDRSFLLGQGIISDACSPIISVTANPSLLTCADLFDPATLMGVPVSLEVVDYWGNTTSCLTEVNLFEGTPFDPMSGNCPNNAPLSDFESYIFGSVQTEMHNRVQDVAIYITEGENDMIMSNAGGNFGFQELGMNGNYMITPQKNDELLNGVTTYDLVLIAKHILGVSLLDSPYKIIAADANNSGSVTTLDLVIIRQMILGIIHSFPGNTSWRFVPESYTFPNAAHPFAESFPEHIYYQNLDRYIVDADFMAIKTGDVNNSATTLLLKNTAKRQNGKLDLNIKNQSISKGENFIIEFQTAAQLSACQFSMDYDASMISFSGIGDDCSWPAFSEDNIVVKSGAINFAWHDATNGEETDKYSDQKLQLAFKAIEDIPSLKDILQLNEHRIKALGYDSSGTAKSIQLKWQNKSALLPQLTEHSVMPNPFNNNTTIYFTLPEAGEVQLQIFDLTGKAIHQQQLAAIAGQNEFVLEGKVLPYTGIYYCKLYSIYGVSSERILFVEQ